MYSKKIKYEDYNGNTREETFYFNLTKAELQDLEWRTPGGIKNYMMYISSTLDGQKLADFFKNLIQMSYGVKDPEGRRFIKNEHVLKNFTETEAYSILYMRLATDDKAAAEFVNGVFPKDVVEEVRKLKEKAEKAGISLAELTDNMTANPDNPVVEGQQNLAPLTPFDAAPVQAAPVEDIPKVEGQVVISPTETPLQ